MELMNDNALLNQKFQSIDKENYNLRQSGYNLTTLSDVGGAAGGPGLSEA